MRRLENAREPRRIGSERKRKRVPVIAVMVFTHEAAPRVRDHCQKLRDATMVGKLDNHATTCGRDDRGRPQTFICPPKSIKHYATIPVIALHSKLQDLYYARLLNRIPRRNDVPVF